jgi:Flp pilus assembly secretin CpaC
MRAKEQATMISPAKHRSLLPSRHAVLAAALLAIGAGQPAAASDLNITIDEAKLLPLKRPAAEIILGNPLIADVAVQDGKLIVVTGKSFGRTNLIVLDSDGKEILNSNLSVEESGHGLVTLHRGIGSVTFYCAPNCKSLLAIGDNPDYFDAVAKEIQTKLSSSRGAAEGTGGGGE